MILRHNRIINLILIGSDLILLNLVFFFSAYLTDELWWQNSGAYFSSLIYQFNTCWIFLVIWLKYYDVDFYFEPISRKTLRVVFSYLLLTSLIIFTLKQLYTSRIFYFLFIGLFFISLLVVRYVLILIRNNFVILNRDRRKTIFIGDGIVTDKVTDMLMRADSGYDLVGYFSDTANFNRLKLLGGIQDSIDYALRNNIKDIFSSIMPQQNEVIHDLVSIAEQNGIRMKFIPDFQLLFRRDVNVSIENNLPIITFRHEPLEELSNRIRKRIFDIFFSLFVFILFLWWLIPIISLLIKITSKGPVFFIQTRSGRNGDYFSCYKFRSMYSNLESNTKAAVKNDTRITRFGSFLRRTNLDEIPQFFNVFLGNMSIVGPRPHMIVQTEEYRKILDSYMIRLYLKPGITGLAQISGYRGELSNEKMAKRLEKDIIYMEEWGLWLDIRIILTTVYLTIKGDSNAF